MSLGDDVLHQLPFWREQAQSLMVDEVEVRRTGTGEPVFDPNTGLLAPSPDSWQYEGPCRIRQPTAQEAEVLFGGEELTRTRFIACLPHDAASLRVGDVIRVLSSQDGDLVGRALRVTAVPMMTFSIYKGYPCEVVE